MASRKSAQDEGPVVPPVEFYVGSNGEAPEVRRKFLGLNAAAVYNLNPQEIRYRIKDDDISKLKMAYRDDPRSVPMPNPRRYRGPRTRREFLAFQAYEKKTWG